MRKGAPVTWLRRLWQDRRGQSVVEFALVAPVMLLLVFGMIQFGLVLNAELTLTEAVRQGAQIVASGGSAQAATEVVLADAPMVQDPSVSVSPSGSQITLSATGSYPVLVPDLPFLGSSVPLSASITMLTQAPPGS